jgi:hypothetical protein
MSIAFSPTSAAIEVDTGEEANGDLEPVQTTGKSRTVDACGRPRVVSPNGCLCQRSNCRAQSGSGRESESAHEAAGSTVLGPAPRSRAWPHISNGVPLIRRQSTDAVRRSCDW